MPQYKVGDQTFRRKNLYLPCAIAAKTGEMSDEEHARVLKAAYWADNITNAEWPVVLRHDGVKAYVRSRLKKEGRGLADGARADRLSEPRPLSRGGQAGGGHVPRPDRRGAPVPVGTGGCGARRRRRGQARER